MFVQVRRSRHVSHIDTHPTSFKVNISPCCYIPSSSMLILSYPKSPCQSTHGHCLWVCQCTAGFTYIQLDDIGSKSLFLSISHSEEKSIVATISLKTSHHCVCLTYPLVGGSYFLILRLGFNTGLGL